MISLKQVKSEFLLFLLLVCITLFVSCKKDPILKEGGRIVFSTDTLMFDTVFTAQGSSTRNLLLFNPEKERINISSIRLEKGIQSPYRLNVNGRPGKEFKDIEIAGKDSLWIFAAITIDPTQENNPFIVEDKLIVNLNNQEFSIPLLAFGQNAYYIVDSVLETQTWHTDKPYIIIKNALVAAGATLTIPAGVNVYMHQDSRLFVQGSLKIMGSQSQKVTFQGDRIDRDVYVGPGREDVPGEWGGLYFFRESYGNEINHAIFKNGGASTHFFGSNVLAATIQVDADTVMQAGQFKLKINNSIIHTSQGYGIVAFNSSIYAENCLIAECGAENFIAFEGGKYELNNCTIATYGSAFLNHSNYGTLGLLNYYPISQNEYIGGHLNAILRNCIIYGSLADEIIVNKKPDFQATVQIENCILKTKEGIGNFVSQINNKINEDPLFVDRQKLDFHLEPTSPALGAGIFIPMINSDLDGKARPNPPSIGCYEL